MVVKIQWEKVSAMTRISKPKTALQEQKIKDPNAGVFIDTSGYVSDSSYVDWSRIYSILTVMIFPLLLMTNIFTWTYTIPSSIALRKDLLLCLTQTLLSGHWITLTFTNECSMILTMCLLLRLVQKCLLGLMVWKLQSSFSRRKFSTNSFPNRITTKWWNVL